MSAVQRRIGAGPATYLIAFATLPLVGSVAMGQVTIVDLGTLGGNRGVEPCAINDLGQVVGTGIDASGRQQAFLWESGTGITGLGFLPGGRLSSATGINELGQVVGRNLTGLISQAFLWESGTGMTGLGFIGDGGSRPASDASGINDLGQVVGRSSTTISISEAFLWESGTGMTGLGFFGTSLQLSQALAINNLGQIVGRSHNATRNNEAFLWEASTGLTALGFRTGPTVPPGCFECRSDAWAINDLGQIAGTDALSFFETEAFLWESGTGMTGLGFLAGGGSNPQTHGRGINDLGQVVGRSKRPTTAYLWENATGMVDLNSLLPPGSGWVVFGADDINNNGEIVGRGVHNGQAAGFLLRLDSNQPPTCTGDPGPFLVNAGAQFSTFAIGDEPDGDVLQFAVVGLPAGATMTPAVGTTAAPPLTATFDWTPTSADVGQHSVRVIFTDPGGKRATCSFQVCVVDLPPCDQEVPAFVVDIGDQFSHTLVGEDPDPGDALTATHSTLPGTATLGPLTGVSPLVTVFEWQPTVDDFGQHDVTVTFTDQGGESIECVFSVFVANRQPTCSPDDEFFRLNIGDPFSVTLTGSDADPGDELSVSSSALPIGATLSVFGTSPADAVLEWEPTVGDVGLHEVDITFTDVNGGQATCSLTLEVVNRPPSCELEVDEELFPLDSGGEITSSIVRGVTVTVGDTFIATFTGDDVDPGDQLELAVTGLPMGASMTPAAGTIAAPPLAATLEWAPSDGDVTGNPHMVDVTYRDLHGDPALCILEIIVNRPPVALCFAEPTVGEGSSGLDITVECDGPNGRQVTLDGSGSFDPDEEDVLTLHWDVSNLSVVLDNADAAVASGIFPIGVTMATLTVADGRGGVATCDIIVRVQDTMPPEVECTTSTAALWPPKHDMREIMLVVSATDTCENPDFIFPIMVTVRSDEPDNAAGVGDGNTTGDVNGQDGFSGAVAVTGSLSWNAAAHRYEGTIQLRAERDGAADGRCYTIDVVALDSQGNAASTSCCVVVPHDGRNSNGYN